MSRRCFLCLFMIVGLSGQLGWAQDTKAEKKDSPKPAVKASPMNVVPPTHADPIARESTRLYCAAVNGAQVTLDPIPLRE